LSPPEWAFRPPGVLEGVVHPPFPEELLGRELVVESADDPEILDGRGPAARERYDVVELEPGRRAAHAAGGDRPRAALSCPSASTVATANTELSGTTPASAISGCRG
jgi:hypothetical protein